jgi:hypothetical protein
MFSGLYTNKFSLPYRLDHVARLQENGGSPNDGLENSAILPSLRYLAGTLDDCRVYNMQLELLAEDRTAAQFGYTQWGPKIMVRLSLHLHPRIGADRTGVGVLSYHGRKRPYAGQHEY